MPTKITASDLMYMGANPAESRHFKTLFPEGVVITPENCHEIVEVLLNAEFNIDLYATWLLYPDEWSAFSTAVTIARDIYTSVENQALATYREIEAQALIDYRHTVNTAASRDTVELSAWSKCHSITYPAWKNYENILKSASTKFKHTKVQTFCDILAKRSPTV